MMTMYIEVFQSYENALARKKKKQKSHMRGRRYMHNITCRAMRANHNGSLPKIHR